MFYFTNYSTKSKYYNDSNKLVVGKMKDQKVGWCCHVRIRWIKAKYVLLFIR